MLQLVCRLFLFLLSSAGYWEFLRRRKLPFYFLPVLTIAVQFLVLFFAGLWNLLPWAALGLYLAGLGLVCYFFWEEKLAFPRRYCNLGYGFFLLGLILCGLAVRGKIIYGYDDFAHWARVVRTMLETQHFPNFSDVNISHQSYPLGSSAFLYYFAMCVGKQESVWILGQCYLLLTTALPLFSLTPKRTYLAAPLILVMVNGIMRYSTPVGVLMVDTLLPIASMVALQMIYQYFFREGAPRDFDPVWTAPLLCLAMHIKNSGALFALFGFGMLLWLAYRDPKRRSRYLLAVLIPLAVLLLWNRHCEYVFPKALEGFHALSTENFSTAVSQKTPEDIRFVIVNTTAFAFTRRELFWLLGCSGVVTGAFLLMKRSRQAIQFLSFSAVLYALYVVGMIGTYIFSMSVGEARILAAIDRYMRTVDISLYYLIGGCALALLSRVENSRKACTMMATLLVLAGIANWQFYGSLGSALKIPIRYERQALQALVEEYGIPKGETYFLCIPEDDHWYSLLMAHYHLDAQDVAAEVIDSPEKLLEASKYRVFINMDPGNPLIEDYLARNYPGSQMQQVIYDFM